MFFTNQHKLKMLVRALLVPFWLISISSIRIGGESCNYGVTTLSVPTLPAGEDYCQNVYFPDYIRGYEIELSYKFTCDYSGSSPQGVVSTYANNGCSGIPSNETILNDGDFYCCQDCDDKCDWLYFDVRLYNDSNCAVLDYYAYDLGILDWVGDCVNLNDSTMYMELNDTLFENKETDDEYDCENGEWDSRFYSLINKCEFYVARIANRTSFYYYASVDDENDRFTTTGIESSSSNSNPASYPTFHYKHNKIIIFVCFALNYYFVW